MSNLRVIIIIIKDSCPEMNLSGIFQVIIIKNMPFRWEDFINYLEHKQQEVSIENLIFGLRTEEDNKRIISMAKVNVVKYGQSYKAKYLKGSSKCLI